MKKGLLLRVMCLLLVAFFMVTSAWAEAWKFGVMADTQWNNSADYVTNPGSVAVGIINQVNQRFIDEQVKFVVQVGDLCQYRANYPDKPQTPRIAYPTRAEAAQALYSAGIGFFPVRGNHDSSQNGAGEVQTNFPQTQGGANSVGATSFSSPSTNLAGLSYAFDYNNARFMLIDQFITTDNKASDGTTYSESNNAVSSQQPWITSVAAGKPVGGHLFVFSHKQLVGQNHTDTLFGTSGGNTTKQNAFYSTLSGNKTGYLFTGHDHMHNRSLVASPNGTANVEQLVCAASSYIFYAPGGLSSHGNDSSGTGYPNAGLAAKNRETVLSQELYSNGYYIVTIDGPRVTVDFYSADPDPTTPDLLPVELSTTPTLTYSKRETFGYSLNGSRFIVSQGGSYSVVSGSIPAGAGFYGTSGRILNGTNGSTKRDYNDRAWTKSVNTGWAPRITGTTLSDVFTLWGMTDLGATNSDTFAVSVSYDPATVTSATINAGHPAYLARKNADGGWVKAASSRFVLGPYNAKYPLGFYGLDRATNTAWAVVNQTGEFAVIQP
jgi:hypothetical protein